jgi:translation initiation factor 4A
MQMNDDIDDNNDNNDKLKIINKWDELDIDHNILRGIYSFGFEDPSPIQRKAIIPIINKQDIIAQAQSGTGKTGAFSIGALAHVDLNSNTNVFIIGLRK